ncbi:MAG: glycosyltransferase family 4 protein [Pseudonocardia sp.]
MTEVEERLDVLIVGFYYPPEPIGIAPYTAGLARGLVERGHRVRVIVGYPHYPWWKVAEGYRGLRRREVIDGVEVVRVRHPVPKDSTTLSRVAMEAVYAAHAATVRGPRPDVVLAVSPALLSVATALTWRKPGRTAVGVITQDIYSRALVETGALGGRGARAAARLEGGLLSRADGVAIIHDIFREPLVGLGVDPARISVIRNWSHIGEPTGARSEVRKRLGWGEDEFIALHTGNMGHKQGLENVVEAARLADGADVPIRFVLMGDGARRRALEALGAGVRCLQFVDPLPDGEFEDALAAADVLVLNEKPGIAEMCVPGKLTSYFAAGRPVVAATDPRSGATAEMRAAGAGTCVDSGRPQLLLDAALRVGRDRAGAAAFGRQGREYSLDVLTQTAALDAYAGWAERLARGRTSGSCVPQLASGTTR